MHGIHYNVKKERKKKTPPNQLGNKEKIKVYLLMHDLHRVLSKSYPLSLSSTSRISNLTILAIQGSILRTVSILTRDLDAREFVKECLLRPWKTKKEKKKRTKMDICSCLFSPYS